MCLWGIKNEPVMGSYLMCSYTHQVELMFGAAVKSTGSQHRTTQKKAERWKWCQAAYLTGSLEISCRQTCIMKASLHEPNPNIIIINVYFIICKIKKLGACTSVMSYELNDPTCAYWQIYWILVLHYDVWNGKIQNSN